MLASIIITNYNYGKYLGECLRSCLYQSLESNLFEVIIIDDCSSDNSLKVIDEYLGPHKNLKIIRNKKNYGVAKSSNIGFKNAKGKYVIRIDADDFINRELLKILVYFLEENPEYFSVACDYYLVSNEGVKIKKISSRENPISCGVLYNRKKLLSMGAYNDSFRHREEEELRARINNKPNLKTYYLNFPLYRYRMHNSNKTRQNDYIKKFKDKIMQLNFKDKFNIYKNREKELIKNVVVVIPARGGSKRIPKKNITKIWGKPMIYWSIQAAKKSKYVNYIYVSSDDKQIIEYSNKLKIRTILRPKNISDDKTFKMEAIRHAVKHISKIKKPSIVISLQANSPDVKSYDIDKSIEKLINFNLNEVISTDENHNQNGTLRTMRYKTTFQEDLSTYCGFIVTNTSDIHTMQDLKNLEKIENYEIK
jgi:glycosyltransferase involved in cell wall biosynthesis